MEARYLMHLPYCAVDVYFKLSGNVWRHCIYAHINNAHVRLSFIAVHGSGQILYGSA